MASLALAALVSIGLGIASLQGFQSPAAGDLLVSGAMAGNMAWGVVLAGTLILLIVALAHAASRRPKHAKPKAILRQRPA